jgi:hypothetical protein
MGYILENEYMEAPRRWEDNITMDLNEHMCGIKMYRNGSESRPNVPLGPVLSQPQCPR